MTSFCAGVGRLAIVQEWSGYLISCRTHYHRALERKHFHLLLLLTTFFGILVVKVTTLGTRDHGQLEVFAAPAVKGISIKARWLEVGY